MNRGKKSAKQAQSVTTAARLQGSKRHLDDVAVRGEIRSLGFKLHV
jgi:hypothetical protein